jgi:hypothetical protein
MNSRSFSVGNHRWSIISLLAGQLF